MVIVGLDPTIFRGFMANDSQIQGIQNISPILSSKVDPVRRYTASERKQKMEMMEAEIKEHAEMLALRREIKEKYPNPGKLSFGELLEQEINGVQSVQKAASQKDNADDDDGFILDVRQ